MPTIKLPVRMVEYYAWVALCDQSGIQWLHKRKTQVWLNALNEIAAALNGQAKRKPNRRDVFKRLTSEEVKERLEKSQNAFVELQEILKDFPPDAFNDLENAQANCITVKAKPGDVIHRLWRSSTGKWWPTEWHSTVMKVRVSYLVVDGYGDEQWCPEEDILPLLAEAQAEADERNRKEPT